MSAAADLGRWTAGHPSTCAGWLLPTRDRPARLSYRFGQRDQVVQANRRRVKLAFVADQIPATGRGQATRVSLAQVVRVRLGERGEGADHRGGVRINIG